MSGRAIEHATVRVFSLDPETHAFRLWDGGSYGQKNPFAVRTDGSYGFVLPNGTYYLESSAFGYKQAISSIVSLTHTQAVVQNITLTRSFGIQLGSWIIPLPDFSRTQFQYTPRDSKEADDSMLRIATSLKDTMFPFFQLPQMTSSGKVFSSLDLRGKNTIITVLNTWSPLAAAQLSQLDALAADTNIRVLVIVPQESTASVETYRIRGSHTVLMIADPDGTLVDSLSYHHSPTHIYVDRKGRIINVRIGLATKQEIGDTSRE